MTDRRAVFPADPAEPFWWGQVPCPDCGEREVVLSATGSSVTPFVCMVCGCPHSLAVMVAADDLNKARQEIEGRWSHTTPG